MRSVRSLTLLLLAPLATVALLVACESDDNRIGRTEFGPGVTVTQPAFNPISSATPARSGTSTTTATPAVAATGAAAASGSGRDVTIVARDNSYDVQQITVRTQEAVRMTFRNEGSARHSWHLRAVTDASGNEPRTETIDGGQTARLTFTIGQPGTFTYSCDVHGEQMSGRLIVQ